MTKHDIFTTPFWDIKGAPQQLVDELYQGAYRFKKIHQNNIFSNQGGYQSPSFDWKEFHPQGIEYINKVVGDMFKFKVQSWWYNINGKGHWNLPHAHPFSVVDYALVWYLTDSDELLHLMDPFSHRCNSENIVVNSKKGDIIVFPSDIIHYVMPNQKDMDRICISMNLQLL